MPSLASAVAHGTLGSTKTGAKRTVPHLIAPLMADLETLCATAPDTKPGALIFPGVGGKPWTRPAYQTWRKRVFKPNAPAGTDIYGLRHGFACMLN